MLNLVMAVSVRVRRVTASRLASEAATAAFSSCHTPVGSPATRAIVRVEVSMGSVESTGTQ